MKVPKPRKPARRNPIAAEIARNPLFRTRVQASVEELAQKNDPWDRNAKHQNTFLDDDDCEDDE